MLGVNITSAQSNVTISKMGTLKSWSRKLDLTTQMHAYGTTEVLAVYQWCGQFKFSKRLIFDTDTANVALSIKMTLKLCRIVEVCKLYKNRNNGKYFDFLKMYLDSGDCLLSSNLQKSYRDFD